MKKLFVSVWVVVFAAGSAAYGDEMVVLRRGFRELTLGLDFAQVESVLRSDAAFAYRGPADVHLTLNEREVVIDAPGRHFVERVLVQFHDRQSYIITLYMDRTRMDYFSLFQQFSQRYGPPVELSPQLARWEDEQTRIVLERPTVVKYIDVGVFDGLRHARNIERAIAEQQREDFLDEF